MTEQVFTVPGSNGNPMGWVVIDSTVNGRSHGGLRISQRVNEAELIILARRMTLKFGFLRIANGGAKAGVIGNPEAPEEERHSLLKRFAAAIEDLTKSRRFLPHADMGTTEVEIRQIFGSPTVRDLPTRDESGFYTSTGVSTAAQVALRRAGKRPEQSTAAIEGFGKVGSGVAKLLSEAGVRIVAISTSCGGLLRKEGLPVRHLMELAAKQGSSFVLEYREAEQISLQDLFRISVDLLCPCAHSGSIHSENAGAIQASIICSGANAPVTPDAEDLLRSRGIVVLPDYLTNSGGVLGGTMSFAGIPKSRIRDLMSKMLEARFTTLFDMNTAEMEEYCLKRFQEAKEAAEAGGLRQKAFNTGMNLYRSGLIPGFLVSRLAARYFQSR